MSYIGVASMILGLAIQALIMIFNGHCKKKKSSVNFDKERLDIKIKLIEDILTPRNTKLAHSKLRLILDPDNANLELDYLD